MFVPLVSADLVVFTNSTLTTTSAMEWPTYASSPLIYFPPELAFQMNVAAYIQVGTTSVLILDVLSNLKGDYKLLVRYRIGVPTVIYFVTRITLLAYMLVRTVFLTLPVKDCKRMYDAINALLVVFSAFTMLLFNIRVCAVYNMHRPVVVFFALSWVAVAGMLCAIPETFTAEQIADTGYCVERIVAPLLGPTTIIVMVNDSFVYGAIAYRIFCMFQNSEVTKTSAKISFVVSFGKTLPLISRALLKDSQLYFTVVLCMNPVLLTCVYLYKVPPLADMFLVLHLVLVNIFSCCVYRDLKMGLVDEMGLSTRGVLGRTSLAFIDNVGEETTYNLGAGSRVMVSVARASDNLRPSSNKEEAALV